MGRVKELEIEVQQARRACLQFGDHLHNVVGTPVNNKLESGSLRDAITFLESEVAPLIQPKDVQRKEHEHQTEEQAQLHVERPDSTLGKPSKGRGITSTLATIVKMTCCPKHM